MRLVTNQYFQKARKRANHARIHSNSHLSLTTQIEMGKNLGIQMSYGTVSVRSAKGNKKIPSNVVESTRTMGHKMPGLEKRCHISQTSYYGKVQNNTNLGSRLPRRYNSTDRRGSPRHQEPSKRTPNRLKPSAMHLRRKDDVKSLFRKGHRQIQSLGASRFACADPKRLTPSSSITKWLKANKALYWSNRQCQHLKRRKYWNLYKSR